MKKFNHETIIVEKSGWEFLWNTDRVDRGFEPLSQERLDDVWNRRCVNKNRGANPKTHPIAENEIRIDKDTFSIKWETVKSLLKDNGYKYRQDGYIVEGIYL